MVKYVICVFAVFFFFKQKTAYEMRISDWSSDVCSSDLLSAPIHASTHPASLSAAANCSLTMLARIWMVKGTPASSSRTCSENSVSQSTRKPKMSSAIQRSEEHTSELQSLMRISYAVFCLKKKKITQMNRTRQCIVKMKPIE